MFEKFRYLDFVDLFFYIFGFCGLLLEGILEGIWGVLVVARGRGISQRTQWCHCKLPGIKMVGTGCLDAQHSSTLVSCY